MGATRLMSESEQTLTFVVFLNKILTKPGHIFGALKSADQKLFTDTLTCNIL